MMHARDLRGPLLLAGLATVLAAGPALAATPDFDAALQRAAEQDKPLVLDFYTEW